MPTDWQTWLEALLPGDPIWHVDGHQGVVVDLYDSTIMVDVAGEYEMWDHDDCTQPETTPFHVWAAAQGESK